MIIAIFFVQILCCWACMGDYVLERRIGQQYNDWTYRCRFRQQLTVCLFWPKFLVIYRDMQRGK